LEKPRLYFENKYLFFSEVGINVVISANTFVTKIDKEKRIKKQNSTGIVNLQPYLQ
jgi:hypothetical protein